MKRKIISVLLCVALIVSVTPVVAAQSTANDITQNIIAENINETAGEPYIIGEIVEKRTEDTKHFLMSDRSIMAAMYNQSVHYDDNGSWTDIDNSFSTNDENEFENKSNSFKTKFSKKSNGNKLVTITKDNYSLSWMLNGANKVNAQISPSNETETEDISVLKNLSGSVTYPEIQNDVNLQYVVSGEDIKENIILQSADAPTEYSFTYKFNNLKYRTNENNQIEFYKENNPENIVFIIDAPYMYDSANAYSNNIEMQVSETSNGFILKLIPEKEWLLSEDRVYPIVIDPTTLSSQKATNVWDITLQNTQTQALNYVAYDFLVGSDTSGQKYRTMLKISNLPSIGVGGIVVNAKVYFYRYGLLENPQTTMPAFRPRPTDDIQVNIHRINELWPEQGAIWNNYAECYDSIVEDYFIYNDTDEYFGVDITNLVNDWYEGSPNYGIMLKANNESAANHVMQFASSDFATYESSEYRNVRPYLTVNYRTCIGLEDYRSYSTQTLGERSNGYINNYNGNLTFSHFDVMFNSLVTGFNVSHIYNSELKDTTGIKNYYGYGWNLSVVHTFKKVSEENIKNAEFVYTDGDGTKHFFVEDSNGNIIDEDGLGYTYSPLQNEGELTSKLTDKDGNILKFDYAGYLRRIIDANNNTIEINYSPIPDVDNYICSITTSSGGAVIFNYDSNYRLTTIKDNSNRTTTFNYTDDKLTSITRPDGIITSFSYEGTKLIGVSEQDGQFINYDYDTQNRISSVTSKGSSNGTGQSLTFNYDHKQTTVLDNVDRKTTYQFDAFGRVTCAYDNENNIVSQTYTNNQSSDVSFKNNKAESTSNTVTYVNNYITNGAFTNGFTGWTKFSDDIALSDEFGLITSNSAKICNSTTTTKVIAQYPSVNENTDYTVSAYIKTDNVESSSHGAGIEIITSNRYLYSNFITGTTDTTIDNGFQKVSYTFKLNSGESLSRITIGLYNSTGTAYIDSAQLEIGDTANKINLITNSSFENNSGNATAPASFTTNFGSTTGNGASNAYQNSGSYSCKIIGSALNTRSIYQKINISGKAGDVYSIGGWGKADSVATTYSSATQKPNFKMHLKTYNGTSYAEGFEIKFNEYVTDWQYTSKTIILSKDYTSLEVYFSYDFNCNTAYFDDIFLYRDTMQSYTYDDNGNVISTADYASQQTSFSYNNDNTLSKVLNPDGTGYEYNYYNHLVQTAKSEQGVESKVTRDSYGNATESYVTNSPYTTTLTSGKTYRIRNKASGLYITNDTQVARQYAYDLSANKSWKLEDAGEGYYRLIYIPSPTRCLTLSTSQTNYEYNLEVATLAEKGTDAYDRQLFKFKVNSAGTYEITPKNHPNQSLRPLGASTTSAAKVTCSATNNFDYFCWYFEDASQSYTQALQSGTVYRLRALHSGLCLDVQGSLIKQYVYLQTRQQRFVITDCDGYYTITLADSPNEYLALDTTQIISGNPIIAVKSTFDDSCKFIITTTGIMGTAIISPKSLPNSSITVNGASLSYSASLVAATDTGARNQRFVLEPTSDTIRSSATYQNNGNFPYTVTDSRGNTTTYTYDIARGLQTGVTDAKGNVTEYEYNSLNDRLNSVTSGASTAGYIYNNDGSLNKITSPSGVAYNFTYDEFGNTKTVSVGSRELIENFYDNTRGLLDYSEYGNGQKIGYTYDILDRVTEKLYNDIVKVKFRYDKFGNLYEKQDFFTNTTYRYNYDLSGRITGIVGSNNTSLNYVYDEFNRIEKYIAKFGDNSNTTEYIYGDSSVYGQKNGLVYGVKQNGTQRISYAYDNLARLQSRTLNTTTPFTTSYSYHQGATAGTTTTLVKTVQNGSDTYEYTYDSLGNITQIKKNGSVYESYTYDSLNQLKTVTRVDDVYEYTYDNGGNIQSVKKNGTVIKSYGYQNSSWRDQLTAFNGSIITYDAIGNPLRYRNNMQFAWSNGRQLVGVYNPTQYGTIYYTYNADGLRASKTVNNLTTQYYWLDGVLLGETYGSNQIIYLYDENGTAYGIIYNDAYYYYSFNALGDIIGILDAAGNIVVEYEYSAWGEILSITGSAANTIGKQNPLRYRGYYYDTETGFYYLQSRYYDPITCRFINADSYVSTGQDMVGHNMFAYCGNNPVNRLDPSGNGWISTIFRIVAAVLTVSATAAAVIAVSKSKPPERTEFSTIDEAAEAWAAKNQPQSQQKERGAIIYEKTNKISQTKTYTIGRTYEGQEDNVVLGFCTAYVGAEIRSFFSNQKMVAFIHSHPDEKPGYHNDFPSGADLFLLNLPGIQEVYVVPWEVCENVPYIIKASDEESWQH